MKLPGKAVVLKSIIHVLNAALQSAIKAADQAHATATHSDNVAENKYDTLGLEAAYLAHGQSQRVQECELEIEEYSKLLLTAQLTEQPLEQLVEKRAESENSDSITIGSLVELIDDKKISHLFFLGPGAAGLKIRVEQKDITVVTPAAPLGKALLGRELLDEFDVGVRTETTSYIITALS